MNMLQTLTNSDSVPGSDAASIGSAYKRVVFRQVPEFPRLVQIETRTGCSASCVFCRADYYREVVLGNVRERSIHDVWNSPRAHNIRRPCVQGNMENHSLCANCQIAPLR